MGLSKEQIDCAVEWWMVVLQAPKFDMLGETRHKQRDDASEMAEVMATMMSREDPVPPDVIKKFGERLKARLESAEIAPYGLFVDYDPQGELLEAAREAGMRWEKTAFPWKTRMWFRNGGVQVATGYGAMEKEILLK